MNRSLKDIENEIVHQILISEICFGICKKVPVIPGRGSDFLPFYFNLNFTKGIISLHSILLSNLNNEISIKNYIKQFKLEKTPLEIKEFESKIEIIRKKFDAVWPVSLRNKICAHVDKSFNHTDFTNAYIAPNLIEEYIVIIKDLKELFFPLANHAVYDYPYARLIKQSKAAFEKILDEDNINYTP